MNFLFLFAYLPIVAYFSLELLRRSPIKEERKDEKSTTIVGAALAGMIVVPTLIQFLLPQVLLPVPSLLYVGILVGFIGVWIRYSAITTLGRYYSRNIALQGEQTIVEIGWYRYIRHPGYLGTFLLCLGFAISTSSLLAIGINVLVFFAAYSYRIEVEERALIEAFGDKYRNYISRTWRLIPFVY